MSLFETTTAQVAGVAPGSGVAGTAAGRADIFGMSQAAEDAVLRPRETGCWPHDLRSALAARVARLNGEEALAERYQSSAGNHVVLADPANDGMNGEYGAVLAFMDKVAARPRDIVAGDIADLQAAGVADADIVRLAELNAYLAYQVRMIAGLRLIGADA